MLNRLPLDKSNEQSARLLVYGILFAGVVLRLAGLNTSALWYDEAFSVVMTRQDLFEMVRNLALNISPPGWEILLWFATRLFGYNELAVRIIPFLASAATLWVTYRLTCELKLPSPQQIVALGLFALLPYQFWIAQEARMYSVYTLLYTLGILWALQRRWLGLTAVMALMLWIHNTAVFYIPALLLVALLLHPREWKSIVITALVAGAAWMPWLPVFFNTAQVELTGFPPFTLTHFAVNLAGAFFADALKEGWQLFGFLAIFLASLVVLLRFAQDAPRNDNLGILSNSSVLLIFVVLVPFSLLIVYAIVFQNIFWYRTIAPLIPAWVLWLSPTLVGENLEIKRFSILRGVLQVLWSLVIIVALVGWSPVSRGSNLHEVVQFMQDEWRPGDIIYHATGTTAILFRFYMPDAPQFLLDEKSSVGSGLTELVKTNTPSVMLPSIAYRRAWIVWSHDEVTIKMKERVEERMTEYVQSCQVVDRMRYWQHWTMEIYLCNKP